MRPSAYDEATAKDTVVEHRDQVKVTFAGGNVFHIQADGVDEHEVRRGVNAAWERAEKLRKELNSDYAGPPASTPEETRPQEPAKAGDDGAGAQSPAAKPEASKPEETAKADDKDDDEDEEPDVERKVRYGDVEGVARMVPVDVVMDFLADHAGRVALLQGSNEARRLSRRVRATDGRCAPIFLTKQDINDRGEVPALFDGLYTLAAARNLDMRKVCVVILPAGRVRECQGMIAAMMRANLSNDSDAEGDELMYRAHSD